MSKKTNYKPTIRTREAIPGAKKVKGAIVLICPFCIPSHPIYPGKDSICGTHLRVTAVQEIISARTVRAEGLVCVKCKQSGGGEMVKYFNGYIHTKDCNPEVQLLTEIPTYSRWAEYVFKLPEKVREIVEKYTGVAQIVNGMTPDGQETGKPEGYFFGRKAIKET